MFDLEKLVSSSGWSRHRSRKDACASFVACKVGLWDLGFGV
jgi:hypothetical protein